MDSDTLAKINLIYEELHSYGARLGDPDPHLEEGSPLAEDERRSQLEPGHRAYLHLRVAHEYLLSIGELVRATKSFHPFGVEQAMCRTALFAACKALYLLEPDTSDERIRRYAALTLRDESSSIREAKDTIDVLGPDDPLHETWAKMQTDLQKNTQFVNARLHELGLTKADFKGEGSLFRAAGKYLDKIAPLPQPKGPATSKSISSEAILVRFWNQTSGYAHANLWPFMRIAKTSPGSPVAMVTGQLDDMVALLLSTHWIFKSAMSLLDQRRIRGKTGKAFFQTQSVGSPCVYPRP